MTDFCVKHGTANNSCWDCARESCEDDAMEERASYEAELARLKTKWINVKDKLPKHQTTCITYTPISNIVCEADYENGKWIDPVENYEEYKGITHWMPMPCPPEPPEKDE